jgi:glycosyltransferase involved in cell wall biosynthesis
MDFGLFFIKPVFSKKASAPTKLGEFLACGVPCLTNTGVGDMDTILQSSRAGICLEEFSPGAYDTAYLQMMELLQEEGLAKRCRQTAEQYFSLEQGIAEYQRIYQELAS